jgi:hypothetical protein
MFRTAARRTTTAILAMVVLLFSQMVLAGYVCPTSSAQEQAAMEMAPGEPCEGMGADPGQPVLCYQHCTNAPQSADGLKVPGVSLPAVVQVLLVPLAIDTAAQVEFLANALQARPLPGPLFLSTLRMRV